MAQNHAERPAASLQNGSADGPSANRVVPQRPAAPVESYTISIRTPEGRVLVAIKASALEKLRLDDTTSLLDVLVHHGERLRAVALQRAAREGAVSVTLRPDDVWWPAERIGH